jgi:hypothetical protein
MRIEKPGEDEYAPFYRGYVARVQEDDVLEVLARQSGQLRELAAGLTPDRETARYEPGKWSVREVLGHLTDAERVFGYRAFCISRGEERPLPGFDENDYVAASPYAERPAAELADEFALVRDGNLAFLRRLPSSRWPATGNANGKAVSLRALAFIMAGHVRHHLEILRLRYGVGTGQANGA